MDVDSALASHESFTIRAIRASDVSFNLTRGQISVDAPNYFTSAFQAKGFSESSSRTLILDKDPMLFKYITLYLSGYKILPLQIAAVPITMSLESALENLLIDANYFDLDGLVAQIKLFMRPPKLLPIPQYLQMSGKVKLTVMNGHVFMSGHDPREKARYIFRIKNSELLFIATTELDRQINWKMEARIPEFLDFQSDGRVTTGTDNDAGRVSNTPITRLGADLMVNIRNPEELSIEINGIEGTVYELSRLLWHQDVEDLGAVCSQRNLYGPPNYCNPTPPSTFVSLEHLVCRYKYDEIFSAGQFGPNETSYLSLIASELYLEIVYPLNEPDEDGSTIQFRFVGAKCQTRARAFSKSFFSQ